MNPQLIENTALGFLAQLPVVDAAKVREVVRMFVESSLFTSGVDREALIEGIAKRLEEKLDLTMGDASMVSLPFLPWLPGRRTSGRVAEFYWNRYRQFLAQGGFPPRVLGTLDKDTDRIVGLLEDPLKEGAWKRRGLVVGHVQSGKTANYIGVISKACDHGYRFIVLLAGTQNNLRRQTQERVEEGFLGVDSDMGHNAGKPGGKAAWTGVGKLDNTRRPIALTSKRSDFRTTIANAAGVAFGAVKEPIVLVVKKQKRVLENLTEWLTVNNQATGGVIRNVPMLLVDDEADNASINTSGGDSPTEINRQIRLLLAKFEQNAYLGYTATPFANIFIDPDSHQEMVKEDLFPRDFIVSLDAPTDYVGASRIFDERGDLSGILREVGDHHRSFPEKHRISHQFEELPESLVKAIHCFVLARAIRILRDRGNDHNSMLVNVSRFNSVQGQVAALISDHMTRLRQAIQGHASLPLEKALRDPLIGALHQVWREEFNASGPTWEAVQQVLHTAVGPIDVKIINNKSADILDYKASKEEGLHVIAVGGLSLSRGFTLEGLTTSYFLRNSIMYDTLLQMGRWFGYRHGYVDLCRVFMTPDAIDWYRHISGALDELRDEFRRMERQNSRPEDFGLKVRSHPESLIITARNKMRAGRAVNHSVSLDGELIETVAVDRQHIPWNWGQLEALVGRLEAGYHPDPDEVPQGLLWRGIPARTIRDFIAGYRNEDDFSINTQVDPVLRYLDLLAGSGLDLWDVCLYNPKAGEGGETRIGSRIVRLARRKCLRESGVYRISGNSRRVASRGAEAVGLTEDQVAAAKADFQETGKDTKNISDRFYRVHRTRPLLMLHALELTEEDAIVERKVAAWGISFPRSGIIGNLVQYVVNVTWWRDRTLDEVDEDEEVVDA